MAGCLLCFIEPISLKTQGMRTIAYSGLPCVRHTELLLSRHRLLPL